ncbi:MAG TPA: ATP-binding cassette domain-containing protein [Burkholderiaceae bacterium]|jgi:ABC-type glutathione transport system ATPase component
MALFELRRVSKTFTQRGNPPFKALDDVSISIDAGECVAIVGESGSGKSTLARVALRLLEPDGGDILLDGESVLAMPQGVWNQRRLSVQPVFQDPSSAFNPRRTAQSSLEQAIHQCVPREPAAPRERALELLENVELRPAAEFLARYPHQLSGGQRQRLGIARALATRPRLIIADEPLSGADVSIRAQVLNLLLDLRDRDNIAVLMITHDMLVARALADRIVVMHRGRVVEAGATRDVMNSPTDPYTRRLLDAVLAVDIEP